MICKEDICKLEDNKLLEFLNLRGYMLFKDIHNYWKVLYHIINIDGNVNPQSQIIVINHTDIYNIHKGIHKIYKAKNNIVSDIFIYVRVDDNRYDIINNLKEYIASDKLTLTKYPFGATQIYSISDAHEYLQFTYGDYMRPKKTHTHR
jgi:hypothetical protein